MSTVADEEGSETGCLVSSTDCEDVRSVRTSCDEERTASQGLDRRKGGDVVWREEDGRRRQTKGLSVRFPYLSGTGVKRPQTERHSIRLRREPLVTLTIADQDRDIIYGNNGIA